MHYLGKCSCCSDIMPKRIQESSCDDYECLSHIFVVVETHPSGTKTSMETLCYCGRSTRNGMEGKSQGNRGRLRELRQD